jgi:hypothetical protein
MANFAPDHNLLSTKFSNMRRSDINAGNAATHVPGF